MSTPDSPKAWMPREEWDALVRGDGCPLCAEVQSPEPVDPCGLFVADLRLSRLRLARNQFPAGGCVLVCTKHVTEPYHLSTEERVLFFDDIMHAAQALERVFRPAKMNYKLLGNRVPHLHALIEPRHYGDPCPGRPIGPGDPLVTLAPREYEERAQLIRVALADVVPRAQAPA